MLPVLNTTAFHKEESEVIFSFLSNGSILEDFEIFLRLIQEFTFQTLKVVVSQI